jgi:hypothetical protein
VITKSQRRHHGNDNTGEDAAVPLPHSRADGGKQNRRDMRPALPMTHFARPQMCEVLEAQRAQQKRQAAGAHQSCNLSTGKLFITNHDGNNSLGGAPIRATVIADPRYPGKLLTESLPVSFKNLLFPKPSASSVRHELLKIDGRLLEVRVRLNPRARRMIVKVNPATGEISVTAPSRRGLAHALDFARGEKDWIAGQLAKAPGPVALIPGSVIPFRGKPHEIRSSARGPAPVWLEGRRDLGQRPGRACAAPGIGLSQG